MLGSVTSIEPESTTTTTAGSDNFNSSFKYSYTLYESLFGSE